MAINIYDNLSDRAKWEFKRLVIGKESAFDMLVSNLKGFDFYNFDDISSRLQFQYFALEPNIKTLKTEGIDGWWQNEAFIPSDMSGIQPLIEIKNPGEKLKKFYSSFALSEVPGKYSIRIPLVDDFTKVVLPFSNNDLSQARFDELLRGLNEGFGIKASDNQKKGKYVRSIANIAIVKAKNVVYRLLKQDDKIRIPFKGKMMLAQKAADGVKYSNIDKVIKIYDNLLKVTLAKNVRALKKNKNKINKDMKFAARIFANLLMVRGTINDVDLNKKAEKCLNLQFANLINRAKFDSTQLKIITELGASMAQDLCRESGITKEMIVSAMESVGFKYENQPETIKEAFLEVKERDYTNFARPLAGDLKNSSTMEESPFEDFENEDVSGFTVSDGLGDIDALNELPEIPTDLYLPGASGELEETNSSNVIELPERFADEIDEVSNKIALRQLPREAFTGGMDNSGVISTLIMQEKEKQNKKSDKEEYEVKELDHLEGFSSSAIPNKRIEKVIDEIIMKILRDTSMTLDTKLKKCKNPETKAMKYAKLKSDMLAHSLVYYQHKTSKMNVSDEIYAEENSLVAEKARYMADLLYKARGILVSDIQFEQDYSPIQPGERMSSYINRLLNLELPQAHKPVTLAQKCKNYINSTADGLLSGTLDKEDPNLYIADDRIV